MKPFLRASLICGAALLLGSSAFAQVAPPAAQGSNSPAAGGPVGCTASLILPVGTYSKGYPMGPYSPGGWAAAPYSALEEFSVLQVLTDGTVASSKRQSTTKIYQDSQGRRRRERPICSQLYANAEAVLVSIDDPVAGYEYDLDPQRRIAYRYSLQALKDSVPAAHGNRPGPHMEVTKEPLGSQSIEGLLAVGTREIRRVIAAGARDNDRPFTIVEEVWYSPEIKAVILEKSIYAGVERRLTNIDRAEPDISLFQPPADYKIEDTTGAVTINYTNLDLSFSANSLTFGPQNLGTPSPPLTVTVSSLGTANLAISAVTVGGTNPSNFATSADTCTGATLTPKSTCKVSLTFTPTASGSLSASVIFTVNASPSPQRLVLTGWGGAYVPMASVSPSSLTFSNQIAGTTSASQPVALSNTGTAAFTIISIATSANFSQTNNCGRSVTAGASCTINVACTPPRASSHTGTLTITVTNVITHEVEVWVIQLGCDRLTMKTQQKQFKPDKTAPAPKPVEVRENPRDGLKYVWIPPGTFTMGCSSGDNECIINEEPAHEGTISKGFWLGQTPVTVAAYRRFSGTTGKGMPTAPYFNPGWNDQEMPVVNVSWDDSVAYCTWAGGRLPTEAEWEYAGRAGSTESRYGPIDEVAWYSNNCGGKTHGVALKRANAWNLYDMLGNVWEWVNDWYGGNYYSASPARDPQGPESGHARILRGGCWNEDPPRFVRVSSRSGLNPAFGVNYVGFRCGGEVGSP